MRLNKLKGLVEKIIENPKKSIFALGLAGLIALTAAKDNVHFGTTILKDVNENHYVWGLAPSTEVLDEDPRGNIYTFGIINVNNEFSAGANIEGDAVSIGLVVSQNSYLEGTELKGNSSAYSGFISFFNLGENSKITGKVSTIALISSQNAFEKNSQANLEAIAYGLLMGSSFFGNKSEVSGDLYSKGIFAYVPGVYAFGSVGVLGLDKHKVSIPKKE